MCTHDLLQQIDQQLRAEVPLRTLARKYGMSIASLSRHNAHHVSAAIVTVHRAQQAVGASFLARMEGLVGRVQAFVDRAERDGKPAQFLGGVRELRTLFEGIARARGEFDAAPVSSIDVQRSTEWLALRSAIFEAVPAEVRLQVAKKLQGLEKARA